MQLRASYPLDTKKSCSREAAGTNVSRRLGVCLTVYTGTARSEVERKLISSRSSARWTASASEGLMIKHSTGKRSLAQYCLWLVLLMMNRLRRMLFKGSVTAATAPAADRGNL